MPAPPDACWLASLALCAAVACTHAPPRPAPTPSTASSATAPPAGPPATCPPDARAALGPDTLEARLLRESAGRVSREGCRLSFHDTTGAVELVLGDVMWEGDARLVHRYRGRVPALDAHLVERRRYEGGSHLLVFPGGALVPIAGPPLLSPDSARFAAWHLDLVAEYDPNVLQIWRRTPSAARLELAITSEDWGPSDVQWIDPSIVEFVQHFPADPPTGHGTRRARLRRQDDRWVVEVHAR